MTTPVADTSQVTDSREASVASVGAPASRNDAGASPGSRAGVVKPGTNGKAKARSWLPTRLQIAHLEQSAPALRIAAAAWIAQWLVGVVAGLIVGHWSPDNESGQAQFITLMIASLATFSCAVLAAIELSKITRGGRSVALALAFVNVAVAVLTLLYSQNWIGAVAQLVFAFAIVRLCVGKTTNARIAIGVGVALLAALLQLGGAIGYKVVREGAIRYSNAGEYQAAANMWDVAAKMAVVNGEKSRTKALLLVHQAYNVAAAGNPESGYQLVWESFRLDKSPEAYIVKAQIFCMLYDLEYVEWEERTLSEEEKGERERAEALWEVGPLSPDDPRVRVLEGGTYDPPANNGGGGILPTNHD